MQPLPSTERIIGIYDGWAVTRRDRCIADLSVESQVFRDSRLLRDESYSLADVRQMLDSQLQVLTGAALREQESQAAAVRALLSAIFAETDRQRVPVNVDAESVLMGASSSAVEQAELRLASRPSLRTLAPIKGADSSKMLAEAYDEIKRLNERMRAMQREFDAAMQDRSALTENVLSMQDTLSSVRAESHQVTAKAHSDLQALNRQAEATIKSLQTELAALTTELSTKLSQSRQFQTLKRMLTEKNALVKELRKKLYKYDPTAAAADGDDDIEAMDDPDDE